MFYIVLFVVLLAFISTALTVRVLLNRRLQRLENQRRKEEEARQIAEANSGL